MERIKEQKAWDEVKRRLEFLVGAYDGPMDPVACRMAAQRLGDAMKDHLPLYEERMESELGPRTEEK